VVFALQTEPAATPLRYKILQIKYSLRKLTGIFKVDRMTVSKWYLVYPEFIFPQFIPANRWIRLADFRKPVQLLKGARYEKI